MKQLRAFLAEPLAVLVLRKTGLLRKSHGPGGPYLSREWVLKSVSPVKRNGFCGRAELLVCFSLRLHAFGTDDFNLIDWTGDFPENAARFLRATPRWNAMWQFIVIWRSSTRENLENAITVSPFDINVPHSHAPVCNLIIRVRPKRRTLFYLTALLRSLFTVMIAISSKVTLIMRLWGGIPHAVLVTFIPDSSSKNWSTLGIWQQASIGFFLLFLRIGRYFNAGYGHASSINLKDNFWEWLANETTGSKKFRRIDGQSGMFTETWDAWEVLGKSLCSHGRVLLTKRSNSSSWSLLANLSVFSL